MDYLLLLALRVLLLKVRQEPIPVLASQLRVLGQFALDHELLDVVYRVHVSHCVQYDLPHRLKRLEVPHRCHSVALHQNVALGQQLQGLQRHALRADEPLATLDEAVLIADEASYLDDVAEHVIVLKDFHRLLIRDGSGQKLNEIACSDNRIWVPSLPRCFDRHASLNEVKFGSDLEAAEFLFRKGPYFLQIFLAVLREKHCERGFLEQPRGIVLRLKLVDAPLVECGIVIPGLLFAILFVFVNYGCLFCHLLYLYIYMRLM